MKRPLAGLGVIAVAVALVAFPPQQTLASWSDTDYEQGSFAAAQLPNMGVLGCTDQAPQLAPTYTTVTWTTPAGMPAAAEYEVVLTKGAQTATLYTVANGVVIQVGSVDLLGFLLGSSGTATVSVRTVFRVSGAVVWTSAATASRTIKYTAPVLGLLLGGWSCS